MTDRVKRLAFVKSRADALVQSGWKETLADLLALLNAHGITSSYGTPYVHPRGVARLVSATYHYVETELGLGTAAATPIAEAFTNKHGRYAYE